MLSTFTVKYTKIDSGYMGQVIEWPEIITEGKTIEECRNLLQDAINEMVLVYKEKNFEIPTSKVLIEQVPVEI